MRGEEEEEGAYFCGFVFGGGNEVGAVGGHLEVGDLHAVFMCGLVDQEFARLQAIIRLLLCTCKRGREHTFASY